MSHQRSLSCAAVLCVVLAFGIPAYCVPISVFNFDADALGTATTFSDLNNGLTATFSSTADPGGFAVGPSFFLTLTANVLLDPGPSGASGIALDIKFSSLLSSVSLTFATDGPGTFFLDAYKAGVIVGGASTMGTVPPGFTFPEGTITFNPVPFDEIVLSSPSTPFFAIDNVMATTAVPEPSMLLLITTGLLGVGSRLRRLSGGSK
jgi:hypothetical protein